MRMTRERKRTKNTKVRRSDCSWSELFSRLAQHISILGTPLCNYPVAPFPLCTSLFTEKRVFRLPRKIRWGILCSAGSKIHDRPLSNYLPGTRKQVSAIRAGTNCPVKKCRPLKGKKGKRKRKRPTSIVDQIFGKIRLKGS